MLDKKVCQEVLEVCLKTGADFSEIFFEKTKTNNLSMVSSKIDDVNTSSLYGVGIRILKGYNYVYGYTNDTSLEGMLKLANELKDNFNAKQEINSLPLEEKKHNNVCKINKYSKDISNEDKVKYLHLANDVLTNYDKKIVQAVTRFADETQEVLIANSKGIYIKDVRNRQRLTIIAVAKDNDNMQQAVEQIAGNSGIEIFTTEAIKKTALDAATSAITMLDATEMVGGVYDVVIHNAFGGVIFHEACGHSLEATNVAKNLSVFSNKLNTKIASECVTAIDDGTMYNEWGSINIDDEGNDSKKNVLIKDGVLRSYLIDEVGARRMDTSHTSSSRRQSYKFAPTSRMTNTYIDNGKHNFEELIQNTKFGLFAKKMGGGGVNPTTGEYNFAVMEGYMIRDGKICEPVKGATLIGDGATTLMNIDMVANNMTQAPGLCGSKSGQVPTNVGQPTIRVKQMTVGGTGGAK